MAKEGKEKKPKGEKRKREAEADADAGADADADAGADAEKKVRLVSPIANPLAPKKVTKKALKAVKAAAKAKAIRRGVKEVVKAVKKGEQGVCVIAGDISPIEVIAHVPILCEEKGVPYAYVPSKEELGAASQTKRPTSIILITCKEGAEYKQAYDELRTEFAALLPKFE